MASHEDIGSGYDLGAAKHELQARAPARPPERLVQDGQAMPEFIKRTFPPKPRR